jgi:Flp pilus assembly protein TadD
VLSILLLVCIFPQSTDAASIENSRPNPTLGLESNPDQVCSNCHKGIYEKYENTPMSRGSGAAVNGLIQGSFLHAASSISYKVFLRNGKAWMSYDRNPDTGMGKGQFPLHGERQLVFFIGSGHRGRTYLYQSNNQWFEAPINYYSKKRLWDMAPNYGLTKTMPDALPIDPNCLHCHTTEVQPSLPEARNKYIGAPFKQAGIGCSACHGDPSAHLAEEGRGPIVNPAKLLPVRRDSVCLQCHLEGNVAIYRAGKSLAQFLPGDDLANYVVYFVKKNAATGGGRASSQYEGLLRSACKIASGDKLTCITCHDPHSSPSVENRVVYYRDKCLACHTGAAMANEHHPEQKDCTVCHMPSLKTTDISHEQTTDHDIQRYQKTAHLAQANLADSDSLIPIGNTTPSDREYGLAYAQLVEQGSQADGEKALYFLQKAEEDGASDDRLHTQIAFLEQMAGDRTGAGAEYSAALRENPYQTAALGNMAIMDATTGHSADAVRLLQRVVAADANQLTAGLDLAFIECKTDNREEALHVLTTLSRLNPDDPVLRKFMSSGIYRGQYCDVH